MAAKQSTKSLSKANKYAKELRTPRFKQLVIRNKKKYYTRKNVQKEIKDML
jgi:hypothetical protein